MATSGAVQTSYFYKQKSGIPGLLSECGRNVVDTFLNDTVYNIDFGLGLVRGTTDFDVKLPDSEVGIFVGISGRELSRENYDFYQTAYLPDEAVNVLRAGRIFVVCETDFQEAGAVYMRYTAGAGGTQLGAFRKDSDGGTAILIDNAQFMSNGLDDGQAIIWLEHASTTSSLDTPFLFQGGQQFQFQGGAFFYFNL